MFKTYLVISSSESYNNSMLSFGTSRQHMIITATASGTILGLTHLRIQLSITLTYIFIHHKKFRLLDKVCVCYLQSFHVLLICIHLITISGFFSISKKTTRCKTDRGEFLVVWIQIASSRQNIFIFSPFCGFENSYIKKIVMRVLLAVVA